MKLALNAVSRLENCLKAALAWGHQPHKNRICISAGALACHCAWVAANNKRLQLIEIVVAAERGQACGAVVPWRFGTCRCMQCGRTILVRHMYRNLPIGICIFFGVGTRMRSCHWARCIHVIIITNTTTNPVEDATLSLPPNSQPKQQQQRRQSRVTSPTSLVHTRGQQRSAPCPCPPLRVRPHISNAAPNPEICTASSLAMPRLRLD